MRDLVSLVLATTIISTNAISLVKRTDRAPQVVAGSIQRRIVDDPIARDRRRFRKRQSNTLTVSLDNEATLYFMNASIGTPPQDFRLHLDTGSSDLWVNDAGSRFCSERGNGCDISGTYNANDSSTYRYLNSDFNISYVDTSGSTGDYAEDTVTISDVALLSQQFGIGYSSNSSQGILGIGYTVNEASFSGTGTTYPNVPKNLMLNGNIASNAYSLWLNDLDASTGSILFGGVNTDKYSGSLETLPIIPEQGYYAEFFIALTAVGSNGNVGSVADNIAVRTLLDSGSSLMYLPNNITYAIYDATNAKYDENEGAAFVDCSLADSDDTIDFTFSSPTIRVPMNELVIPVGYNRGKPVCILGIGPAEDTTVVLGDTFLRSAYVVYDMTSNEISLAQTRFNSTTDNIMEITNSTGVPGATPVQNAVTKVAGATGGARINGYNTMVNTASQTPPPMTWIMAVLGAIAAMYAL